MHSQLSRPLEPISRTQVTLSDLIQIHPQDFDKRSARALEDNINAKYADKVIQRIGLCLGFYDLLTSSEGLIGHGTGLVNVHVTFRLIVFRPFKGEILQGTISRNSMDGITVSMGFFHDVFVPAGALWEGTRYEASEDAWIWKTEDGNELFLDRNETVRFRVEGEEWTDLSPEKAVPLGEEVEETERRSPYSIIVSSGDDGYQLILIKLPGIDATQWAGSADLVGQQW